MTEWNEFTQYFTLPFVVVVAISGSILGKLQMQYYRERKANKEKIRLRREAKEGSEPCEHGKYERHIASKRLSPDMKDGMYYWCEGEPT